MSRNFNEPLAPKPYDFVPFAKPVRDKTIGHHQLRQEPGYNSGQLEYQLRVLSPVFVASGSYALGGEDLKDVKEPIVRACYRIADVAAVPGSTLKGVVRSVVEAISPSCVSTTRVNRSLIPFLRDDQAGNRPAVCTPEQACPACSMFGLMSRMSNVVFTDARLVKGRTALRRLPALFGPHVDRAAHVYQDNGKYKGRKFYFHGKPAQDERQPPVEVIEPGSLLRGEVQFENLGDAELGLLLFALGLDGSFVLKLGGGKPACLGSVQVVPSTLELLSPEHFLQAESGAQTFGDEAMVEAIRVRVKAAYERKFILITQRNKLREIWRKQDDRECPAGPY